MNICDFRKCTGCSACSSICPKQCIIMKQDSEGFERPIVNEDQCVNCGICKKTCPINQNYCDDKRKPITYAIQNKSDEIRKKSSSGGVFYLTANWILNNGGVVFGAGYDQELSVIHKAVFKTDDLYELCGSKYVQSKIGDSFKNAKKYLNEGKLVLFTGTPCQIEGLYGYLGKEYCNLYTHDFICHGVPSPKMWTKYLLYRRGATGSDPICAEFRNKTFGWRHYSLRIKFRNGENYIGKNIDDPYIRAFIMNMSLRQSCERCNFKRIHRNADITLADFWAVEEILPSWDDNEGTSLVMVHSEKGEYLLKQVLKETKSTEIDFDDGIKNNPSMTCSVPHNSLRKLFLKDLDKIAFDKLYIKYCGNTFSSKMRRRIAWAIGRIERILYEK